MKLSAWKTGILTDKLRSTTNVFVTPYGSQFLCGMSRETRRGFQPRRLFSFRRAVQRWQQRPRLRWESPIGENRFNSDRAENAAIGKAIKLRGNRTADAQNGERQFSFRRILRMLGPRLNRNRGYRWASEIRAMSSLTTRPIQALADCSIRSTDQHNTRAATLLMEG